MKHCLLRAVLAACSGPVPGTTEPADVIDLDGDGHSAEEDCDDRKTGSHSHTSYGSSPHSVVSGDDDIVY